MINVPLEFQEEKDRTKLKHIPISKAFFSQLSITEKAVYLSLICQDPTLREARELSRVSESDYSL